MEKTLAQLAQYESQKRSTDRAMIVAQFVLLLSGLVGFGAYLWG